MFGNFGHESAGLTAMHEIGQAANKGGVGWNQATGPRRRAFEAFAASLGLPVSSDEANVAFIIHECLTSEKASIAALKLTKTRDAATACFMQKNERPGVPALDSRLKWAKVAEAARLQAEKSIPQVSILSPAPAAPVAAPVPAPVAVAPAGNDALLAAVEALYVKLLDFVAATAVSKGVPSAAVSVARMLLTQFDVPKYAVNYLLKLAASKGA